jgi:hypothetical protein
MYGEDTTWRGFADYEDIDVFASLETYMILALAISFRVRKNISICEKYCWKLRKMMFFVMGITVIWLEV